MTANNSPTVATRRSFAQSGAWGLISSGVGYHLDNLARWLTAHSPRIASAYAALLAPSVPKIRPRPGWRFAEEYYDRRLWLACRRGALWEAAKQQGAPFSLHLPWYDNTTVDVTLGNDNSLCLYVCGTFEPNEFAFLEGFLKPGMVFVDVGANDGYYTLFAARRVGSGGKVVAVEPSTRERINLRRNLAQNGLDNVSVVPAALGAAPGDADLHLAQGVHSGHNTLGKFAHDDVTAVNLERVSVKTLDKVAAELNLQKVDFVKVDVEGAEASVVAGARTTLATMRPVMLLEINDGALCAQGIGAEALLEYLRREFGYETLVFSPDTGRLEPYAEASTLSPNVVAIPKERLSEFLDVA
ncbi:MAG: FkbM family methyltransferase [Proteobacteria bacterium]|nr:FkbM family methyltransferase [Pseudomonadota bacterium]MBS0546225.1 FkbM family methyltransferase [Pseudomonadota bacterium]